METSEIVWEIKKDSIRKAIQSGKRSDGRALDEYRNLEFLENYVPKAQGSCLVKLGDTQVLVGIKMDVGEPYPDSPDRGNLSTSCELVPLASPEFSAGPPDEESIEIARVVDRGIRESKMIDFEKLCISEGEKVWTVLVDIHVLDHDGNLIDAASLAAVKALLNSYLPKYEDDKIIYKEKGEKLPVRGMPVSSSFANVAGKNLLDPTYEEEKVMDSKFTVVTTENGEICAIQKSGSGPCKREDIEEMVDIAIKRGKDIRKMF
jgi:exosome complex component RRP42